jgi:hypothetical protein
MPPSEVQLCDSTCAAGRAAAGWQAQQVGCGPVPQVGGCPSGGGCNFRGLGWQLLGLGWQLLQNGAQWLASTSPAPQCDRLPSWPPLLAARLPRAAPPRHLQGDWRP